MDDNIKDIKEIGFSTTPLSSLYEINLFGVMSSKDSPKYLGWENLLRSMTKNDIAIFYINSPGGELSVAQGLLAAMDSCQGQIVAQAQGECCSAATEIFLKAHKQSIVDNCSFMIHNYSGGVYGKGGDIESYGSFSKKWNKKRLKNAYKGFLTKKELKQVLLGKDIYIDYIDVRRRIEKLNKDINNGEIEENGQVVQGAVL